MGNIAIEAKSKLSLNPDSKLTLNPDSKLTLNKDSKLRLYPLATHIKEVNHIDPLSIESMHVSEVKNIEPLQIAKFNVTNLPMVNISLQKLPAVDFNVKSLPPVSVGTHQNFCAPSDYTLRARVLGVELVRLHLNGKTSIIPKERARREQARSDNRSFPETSVAGNPAIPSHCESSSDGSCNPRPQPIAYNPQLQRPHRELPQGYIKPITRESNYVSSENIGAEPDVAPNANTITNTNTTTATRGLSFGAPTAAFQLPDQAVEHTMSEHRLMSGD